jgi:dihydrofolate reductase
LKEQHGRDIILYGSNMLLTHLLAFDLVDEYRIWLHPVALGKGRSMFDGLRHSKALKLAGMQTFCSGVVLLSYQSIYVQSTHPGYGGRQETMLLMRKQDCGDP